MLKYCLLYETVQVQPYRHPIHGFFPSSNFCEPLTHVQVFINAASLKSPGGPRPVLWSLYATSHLHSFLHKVRTSVKNEFLLKLII